MPILVVVLLSVKITLLMLLQMVVVTQVLLRLLLVVITKQHVKIQSLLVVKLQLQMIYQ